MHKGGGVQGEGVERGFDLAFFYPPAGERIVVGTFNGKHAVLEHPERVERLGVRRGKIDVPLSVNVVQFRRPNQLAHWSGVGFTPDHHLCGMT